MRRALDAVGGKLASESDERRAIEIRLRDARHEIRRPRSERRETHARDAAGARHRFGHERGRRLVACQDELEPGFTEPFDEIDDLAARMAGDVAHTRGAQTFADDRATVGPVRSRPVRAAAATLPLRSG